LTKLRGYLALSVVGLALLLLDPIQRLVVGPWARLVPSRRIRLFTAWQRFLAQVVIQPVQRIGGARIPTIPRIPGREGILVLMNHQSFLDIPLLVAAIHDAYPKIVTRKRYLRWIPTVSHLVRLYEYPVVDPSANPSESRSMLASIRAAARDSDVPLAIFPEGTRTKDGEIGRFHTTGLKLILRQRAWTVYVLVADGFWERAKIKHFLDGLSAMRGAMTLLGPFEWEDPRVNPEPFMEDMRRRMVDALAQLRAATPA